MLDIEFKKNIRVKNHLFFSFESAKHLESNHGRVF